MPVCFFFLNIQCQIVLIFSNVFLKTSKTAWPCGYHFVRSDLCFSHTHFSSAEGSVLRGAAPGLIIPFNYWDILLFIYFYLLTEENK